MAFHKEKLNTFVHEHCNHYHSNKLEENSHFKI